MRVEVFFSSSQHDGASTKSFFKLPFDWSALPSPSTETSVMVDGKRGKVALKGVVINVVKVTETLGKVLFKTEMSTEDLREVVLPGRLSFTELPDWLS